jgi:hypothetical protein
MLDKLKPRRNKKIRQIQKTRSCKHLAAFPDSLTPRIGSRDTRFLKNPSRASLEGGEPASPGFGRIP